MAFPLPYLCSTGIKHGFHILANSYQQIWIQMAQFRLLSDTEYGLFSSSPHLRTSTSLSYKSIHVFCIHSLYVLE